MCFFCQQDLTRVMPWLWWRNQGRSRRQNELIPSCDVSLSLECTSRLEIWNKESSRVLQSLFVFLYVDLRRQQPSFPGSDWWWSCVSFLQIARDELGDDPGRHGTETNDVQHACILMVCEREATACKGTYHKPAKTSTTHNYHQFPHVLILDYQ